MSEAPADFGTGLRAHLHLDELEPTSLDVALAKVEQVLEPVAEPVAAPIQPLYVSAPVDPIAVREAALEEREYQLALREANLAGRAATILAAAQALYDSVPATGSANHENDELARLRRRKTVA
jgi:hypothetical protein